MNLNDIIWILFNGIKNRDILLKKCPDFETKFLVENIFLNYDLDSDINIEQDIDMKHLTPEKREKLHIFGENLNRFIEKSPHNLRLIILHLIDVFIVNFSFLSEKRLISNLNLDKNNLSKLDLFPLPYIEGYKDFLYLYELKVRCFESICFEEWTDLLSKLISVLEKNKMTAHLNFTNFQNVKTHDKFSIVEIEKNILFNKDDATLILNMLQNSDIFNNVMYISLLLRGLIIIKISNMRTIAELYLKHALIIASELGMEEFNIVASEKVNGSQEIKFWVQIYSLISLSVTVRNTKCALVYVKSAQRLMRDAPISMSENVRIRFKMYILLSKFHILIGRLEQKIGKDNYFCTNSFNKLDALPLLIMSTFEEICLEISENESYLTNQESMFILKYITEYIDYIAVNCPNIFSIKNIDEISWNKEIEKTLEICSLKIKRTESYICETQENLLPIDFIFSYLVNGQFGVKYKHFLIDFHSDICWKNIIPNILLRYSNHSTNSFSQEIGNQYYFAQLAEQLLEFIDLVRESSLFQDEVHIERYRIAEIYLFISLYTYFGKDDMLLSSELIQYGFEILDLCNECFDVCCIQCILSYLNLIIKLRSSDEDSIESLLFEIINYGKKTFGYLCPKSKQMLLKKKLVNFTLIQAYTLFALLKNDCYRMGTQELMFHLDFEDSKYSHQNSSSFSELNNNSFICKYFKIADKLKGSQN